MSVLNIVIIILAVAVVNGLILKAAKPRGATVDGRTTVAYGRGIRGLAVGLLAIAVACAASALFVSSGKGTALFVALFLLILDLPVLLEVFHYRIVYSDEGMEIYSPWGRNRKMEWGDVRGVEYSDSMKWHMVKTGSQGTVRLGHDYISGIPALLEELERRGVIGSDY